MAAERNLAEKIVSALFDLASVDGGLVKSRAVERVNEVLMAQIDMGLASPAVGVKVAVGGGPFDASHFNISDPGKVDPAVGARKDMSAYAADSGGRQVVPVVTPIVAGPNMTAAQVLDRWRSACALIDVSGHRNDAADEHSLSDVARGRIKLG